MENIENLENTVELNEEELSEVAGGKNHQFVKTIDEAPVRRRPGRDAQVIGRLAKGTVVSYLGEIRNTSDGLRWAKVSYTGQVGWLSNKFSKFV